MSQSDDEILRLSLRVNRALSAVAATVGVVAVLVGVVLMSSAR